ncbi:MAG: PqqD family protein, partial [Acidimicrobiales bacterium]|nr:PqqD family protein [Acidimicrobiales bacterium]
MTYPRSTATVVRRSGEALEAIVDGQAVLLSIDSGDFYELNGTASVIWSLIDGDRSVGEIVEALHDEFDVDEQRCRDEVLDFVGRMVANNLAVVG